MMDAPNPYEAWLRRLAAQPGPVDLGTSAFTRPGAGVLVWDRAVERLLWASEPVEGLRDAYHGNGGRLFLDPQVRERLRALADGLAPVEGARLERLRLDPERPWLAMTCACRLARLEDGETVLVTAFVGSAPKLARRRAAPPPEEIAPRGRDAPARRGTVRFVWQADAEGRFSFVSSSLAEALGPVPAAIVGRTWDEVARSVVRDPQGAVARSFARRETWGGHTVFWSIDDGSRREVPVTWGGMPVIGADGTLAGFRGFGLLRLDEMQERPDAAHEADDDPWFSQVRDRVAQALAGERSFDGEEAKPQDEEDGEEPRPRNPAPQGSLTHAERHAFREIARALAERLDGTDSSAPQAEAPVASPHHDPVLDKLPIGILIHRGERILFANRFLLDLAGFAHVDEIGAEGGIFRLFPGSPVLLNSDEDAPLSLMTRQNETIAVTMRPSAAEWKGEPAQLMVIKVAERSSLEREREGRVQELEAILDTATDGVIVLDETGRILSLNRSAEALFGYDQSEVIGDAVTVLLAPESHIVALDYLESLRGSGVASLLNDGREVMGRERQGGTIPLFMTMGQVDTLGQADAKLTDGGSARRFCAVLRDITAFKRTEGELVGAKRAAEQASAQKSDLLAKISHEIRTPLNAIIGFAEMMLEERFGPIGNERYKDYLKDVHASGAHVISLVNDLLDLAKVEAGRLELSFKSVNLNELMASCVALLQPQAARARIVMRTSFAEKLPPVMADERSVRQIALNLLSNAIKFTDAGGQVIVSTAMTDRGEVALRVRDTGIGMTAEEVEAALEPFRQLATARVRGGTGLGLPLTKALVEANRGALQISSQPNEGTLVDVIFPPARVLAD